MRYRLTAAAAESAAQRDWSARSPSGVLAWSEQWLLGGVLLSKCREQLMPLRAVAVTVTVAAACV